VPKLSIDKSANVCGRAGAPQRGSYGVDRRGRSAPVPASAVSQKSQSFRLLLLGLGFAERAATPRPH